MGLFSLAARNQQRPARGREGKAPNTPPHVIDGSRAALHLGFGGAMRTTSRACTSCETPVPDGAAFCPHCGAATPTDLLKQSELPQVEFGHTGRTRESLPPDLLDMAGRRLGLAALIYAGTYLIAYALARITTPWIVPGIIDALAAAFVVLSLGVFLLARFGGLDSRLLLDLGLVYEVVGAAGIEVSLMLGQWPAEFTPVGISWVCVWIVVFPLIVPSTRGKTFIAAFLAASMTLLAYAIGVWRGGHPLATSVVVSLTLPNYVCAAIAVAASGIVYRMGSAIGKARRMGSYRLVARIGEGGMGEVWRAKHQLLARPAAIKLIRPETLGGRPSESSADHQRRFEREAQATALLRSPHTIELFDFGVTDDGTFYYVMELLDGFDLETLIQWFGPLPPQRAVHVLRQACDSLGEAHEQGLIHRDIKPANIFLCRYGRQVDFVKVLDFGLVKSGHDSILQDAKVTGVGVIGTPSTMAPEQILGNRPIDARTDIYGLGCVGYWLLTGVHVFEAETVAQLIARHIETPPTPPSERVEQEIPESLDNVILACLQKDPDQRPQTADALSDMLASSVGGESWTIEQAKEWWSERIPTEVAKTQDGEQRILMPSLVDTGGS